MSALYREMMDRRSRYGCGYKSSHYRSSEVAYSNTERHKEKFDASNAPLRPDRTAGLMTLEENALSLAL